MAEKELAQSLKDEGNTLFVKRMYVEAIDKFTVAINIDGTNAVLYANRAACKIHLRRYLDAADDASKAVTLDSSYAKGWWRLAQASQELGKIPEAIQAWQRALQCIPRENASDAQERQRTQYRAGLQNTIQALVQIQTPAEGGQSTVKFNQADTKGEMPWDRAEVMLPQLRAQGGESLKSSAFVIHAAYYQFKEFCAETDRIKSTSGPNGGQTGPDNLIQLLVNSLIIDSRAVTVKDTDFIDKYNHQILFEARKHHAWQSEAPEVIFAQAQQCLLKEGWESVRPALRITLSAWIIQGFLAVNHIGQLGPGITSYRCAVDFLERGRQVWRSVPTTERGMLFERTHLSGVKSLWLDAYMQGYKAPNGKTKFPLKKLLEGADELLKDIEEDQQPSYDTGEYPPGHISAFWIYPAGHAHAMKGFSYSEMARARAIHDEPDNATKTLFEQAAKEYLAAADLYPADDEHHAVHLCNALACHGCIGTPLSICLPIMARLRTSVTQMQHLWEYSSFAVAGRDRLFTNKVLEYEQQLREDLKEGRITEEDAYRPPYKM